MGYRDDKMALSKSQALTGDADSTYYIDTELTYPGWEKGGPLGVVITIEAVTVASTGITFILCHKDSEPTLNTDNLLSITLLAAALTKGTEIVIPIPQGIKLQRYLRLYYDLTNGAERYTVSSYVTPYPISQQ
jgi:hypothetical protein